MKILSIVLVIFIFILSDINGQLPPNSSEVVIYTKINEGDIIYIQQSEDSIVTYNLNQNECADVSHDGRYIAILSKNPKILKIVYLPAKKEIIRVDWQVNWESCGLYWTENDILSILTTTLPVPTFQISGISLIDLTIQPTQSPTYPSLPHFYPSDKAILLLPNPTNRNIYLYQKCLGYQGEDCPSYAVVIYDLIQNREVEELVYQYPEYMLGYELDSNYRRYPISESLVSWSLDGRYLAYFRRLYDNSISDEGRIIIYDLYSDNYLADNDALYLPNINRNFQWSSNNILLVWQTRPFMEGYSYHSSLTFFSFFYADTQTAVNGDKPFDVLSQQATFAPDGRAIAFIGKALDTFEYPDFGSNPRRGELVMMSTTTGESTVIDTNVTEIITWRSICDFTPTDTASLISTMQTEPYSVICLAENGQYDLTAPLPDVAGDITIIGNGARINMTTQNRIFNVVYNQQWSRNGTLTLKNVTISGGNATEGGAIYNAGELNLENAILENNSALRGGGIYNAGVLTMNGGAIQNNAASEFGGGIYNVGEMTLDGVNIRENDAPEGSGVYQGE